MLNELSQVVEAMERLGTTMQSKNALESIRWARTKTCS